MVVVYATEQLMHFTPEVCLHIELCTCFFVKCFKILWEDKHHWPDPVMCWVPAALLLLGHNSSLSKSMTKLSKETTIQFPKYNSSVCHASWASGHKLKLVSMGVSLKQVPKVISSKIFSN